MGAAAEASGVDMLSLPEGPHAETSEPAESPEAESLMPESSTVRPLLERGIEVGT